MTVVNERLRQARQRKFGSIEKAAARCGVGIKSLTRWELGQVRPNWSSLQLLMAGFAMSPEELGFEDLITDRPSDQGAAPRPPTLSQETTVLPAMWEDTHFVSPLLGDEKMKPFDPSRRQTIEQLLRLGGILSGAKLLQTEPWLPLLSPHAQQQPHQEIDLPYFADLVRHCWSLSSAQLSSVEQLLPVFLPVVEKVALQAGVHQRLAANIASQAEQLASIVALHRDDLLAMERHRQRAVAFGQLSGDVNLHAAALLRLATTYYYLKRPRTAYTTYHQALPLVAHVTPLVAARIFIGLAEAAARCGEVQQAHTYLTKAHEVFPAAPEKDPAALYADGGHFTLALWESMTYMELGEPGEAEAALLLVKRKPTLLLPERVQAELINHQATATIAQRRLEESAALVEQGVTQALQLGSQRRYNEAYDNYQQMRLLWRNEQRVRQLDDLFRRA